MNKKVKRMTYITMLLAMSVLLHLLESMIEIPFPVPGVKLGFANIIGLIAFFLFNFKVMVGLNLARVLLASLIRGILFGFPFWMSFAGVSLSTLMVGIFGYKKKMSCMMLSVISSIFHCVGQIIAAFIMTGTTTILYYFPIMLLLSIPTGLLTGYLATEVIKRIQKNFGKDL